MSPVSVHRLPLHATAQTAFDWHARPGAFERLSPPWRRTQVIARTGGITDGARIELDAGFPIGRWSLEHFGHVPGRMFCDRQITGPFARWEHTHAFTDDQEAPGQGMLEDRVDWALPLAPLTSIARGHVQSELERLFAWRHRVTTLDLDDLARRPSSPGSIAVTGSSGMIGSALCAYLSTQGFTVRRLVRRPARSADEISWDPARGVLDPASLEAVDSVIHLAGAGLADAPWTDARKRELVQSRVDGTRTLARALAEARGRCRTLVSASAVGLYGDRGEEWLEESSGPGTGFLAELATAWEAAAAPAEAAGVRVTHPRIGIVLWPQGGALAELLVPFRLGAGGPLGSGRPWWAWVTLPDLVSMLVFAATHESMRGPFHAVAPQPVRMRDLAHTIGRVISRPSFLSAPSFALRALLGREMADAILLSGQRLGASVLERNGYRFRDPELEPAMRTLFGRGPASEGSEPIE